ncbi:hypothetical protein KAJ27_01180, partial [bacterium]|nr:hypothetical protein [bacterium]
MYIINLIIVVFCLFDVFIGWQKAFFLPLNRDFYFPTCRDFSLPIAHDKHQTGKIIIHHHDGVKELLNEK